MIIGGSFLKNILNLELPKGKLKEKIIMYKIYFVHNLKYFKYNSIKRNTN